MKTLAVALAGTALLGALAACTSFGTETDPVVDAPETGLSDTGAVDAAPPPADGGPVSDAADDGDPSDAGNPDADGGKTHPSCTTSATCPAGTECCMTAAGSSCFAAGQCDGFTVSCTTKAVCDGGSCCLDDVTGRATCQTTCSGAKHALCTVTGDCPTPASCRTLDCTTGSAMNATPFSLCATNGVMYSRGGLSCATQ